MKKDARSHHQSGLSDAATTLFSPSKIMLNDNATIKPLILLTTAPTALASVAHGHIKNNKGNNEKDVVAVVGATVPQRTQTKNRTSPGKFFWLLFISIIS